MPSTKRRKKAEGFDAHTRARAAEVEPYRGPRPDLRHLFALAEDSAMQLEGYIERGEVLVARVDGQIVGHLQLIPAEDDRSGEIQNMAVVPERQGHGIGRTLVAAGLAEARRREWTQVRVATATADIANLRFYQRLGFRMARVERDAFVPTTGYPTPIDVDGIALRDRVWFDREP